MKKKSIKNVAKFLSLCLTISFLVSCSSSDDKEVSVVPTFTKTNTTKTEAFIEEAITLTVEGKDFTDIKVTSSNSSVVIKKITTSTYEIKSPVAASTNITVELSNSSNKNSQTIKLNFHEHGVKDLGIIEVEGIKVDDNATKVLAFLGEPDSKTSDSTGDHWNYVSKGLSISFSAGTSFVNAFRIYSLSFTSQPQIYTKLAFKDYPNDILYSGWKIDNSSTTMDAVVKKLGTPRNKFNNNGYTEYSYNNGITFVFSSNGVDDIVGKTIKYIFVSF
jgi:hypothetical protein